MTTLTANDAGVIWQAQLSGEGRWVRLALSLADLTSANRFFVSAERLLYEMDGADYEAAHYGLPNWQGGIISGARYAFRAAKAPTKQVCLHELRGRLGSGDVWAVSAAASLAVAWLLGGPKILVDLGGWRVDGERRPQRAEDGSQSTKIVSSERESPQARGDSPVSGRTDPDQASQAILAARGNLNLPDTPNDV